MDLDPSYAVVTNYVLFSMRLCVQTDNSLKLKSKIGARAFAGISEAVGDV
jgi:hypothetical protein